MDATGWSSIEDVLNDLDFPATRDEVVGHAERHGGQPGAVALLRTLPPNVTYQNLAEVHRSVRLDPAAEEGQTADLKARQSRSRHSQRIAEHLRRPEE